MSSLVSVYATGDFSLSLSIARSRPFVLSTHFFARGGSVGGHLPRWIYDRLQSGRRIRATAEAHQVRARTSTTDGSLELLEGTTLTMLAPSNAYTLTVRQGPERGKAFAGPKEKGETASSNTSTAWRLLTTHGHQPTDRKPVDPPPIIQLQIRDPTDPAS